jgi:hypothetical protein
MRIREIINFEITLTNGNTAILTEDEIISLRDELIGIFPISTISFTYTKNAIVFENKIQSNKIGQYEQFVIKIPKKQITPKAFSQLSVDKTYRIILSQI